MTRLPPFGMITATEVDDERERMRKRVVAAIALLAALGVAAPALATPVDIRNDGGCRKVFVNDKQVTKYSVCYLGPPPPAITR